MGRHPQMRRRTLTAEANRGTADAVGAARDAAESEGTADEGGVSSTAPRPHSPARPVRGAATEPHRGLPPPRRRAEHCRRNAGDTETTPRQAGTSRCERIAAAKLSELAAGARAGWDATTLERLIAKGLTRYYWGADNEARRALAAAEPPLIRHRLGRRSPRPSSTCARRTAPRCQRGTQAPSAP